MKRFFQKIFASLTILSLFFGQGGLLLIFSQEASAQPVDSFTSQLAIGNTGFSPEKIQTTIDTLDRQLLEALEFQKISPNDQALQSRIQNLRQRIETLHISLQQYRSGIITYNKNLLESFAKGPGALKKVDLPILQALIDRNTGEILQLGEFGEYYADRFNGKIQYETHWMTSEVRAKFARDPGRYLLIEYTFDRPLGGFTSVRPLGPVGASGAFRFHFGPGAQGVNLPPEIVIGALQDPIRQLNPRFIEGFVSSPTPPDPGTVKAPQPPKPSGPQSSPNDVTQINTKPSDVSCPSQPTVCTDSPRTHAILLSGNDPKIPEMNISVKRWEATLKGSGANVINVNNLLDAEAGFALSDITKALGEVRSCDKILLIVDAHGTQCPLETPGLHRWIVQSGGDKFVLDPERIFTEIGRAIPPEVRVAGIVDTCYSGASVSLAEKVEKNIGRSFIDLLTSASDTVSLSPGEADALHAFSNVVYSEYKLALKNAGGNASSIDMQKFLSHSYTAASVEEASRSTGRTIQRPKLYIPCAPPVYDPSSVATQVERVLPKKPPLAPSSVPDTVVSPSGGGSRSDVCPVDPDVKAETLLKEIEIKIQALGKNVPAGFKTRLNALQKDPGRSVVALDSLLKEYGFHEPLRTISDQSIHLAKIGACLPCAPSGSRLAYYAGRAKVAGVRFAGGEIHGLLISIAFGVIAGQTLEESVEFTFSKTGLLISIGFSLLALSPVLAPYVVIGSMVLIGLGVENVAADAFEAKLLEEHRQWQTSVIEQGWGNVSNLENKLNQKFYEFSMRFDQLIASFNEGVAPEHQFSRSPGSAGGALTVSFDQKDVDQQGVPRIFGGPPSFQRGYFDHPLLKQAFIERLREKAISLAGGPNIFNRTTDLMILFPDLTRKDAEAVIRSAATGLSQAKIATRNQLATNARDQLLQNGLGGLLPVDPVSRRQAIDYLLQLSDGEFLPTLERTEAYKGLFNLITSLRLGSSTYNPVKFLRNILNRERDRLLQQGVKSSPASAAGGAVGGISECAEVCKKGTASSQPVCTNCSQKLDELLELLNGIPRVPTTIPSLQSFNNALSL